MIEVERKFSLQPGDKERLITSAQFMSEKDISDTYYDKPDYSLTTQDIWLRKRDGIFELKVSVNIDKKQSERKSDQYKEVVDEEEIRQIIGLPSQDTFEKDLQTAGYTPYGSWVTSRTEYKKDGFTIDFDEVDFGLSAVEIELLVEDESLIQQADEKIVIFAKEHNLVFEPMVGKNTEYLRRFKPDHYNALVGAGII